MTDLAALLSGELVDAIERMVDERVEAVLAERQGDESSPWRTRPEAADYMRTSVRTLDRLIKRKLIRCSYIGRTPIVNVQDMDAFLRATTGEDVAPTTSPRRRGSSLDPVKRKA